MRAVGQAEDQQKQIRAEQNKYMWVVVFVIILALLILEFIRRKYLRARQGPEDPDKE